MEDLLKSLNNLTPVIAIGSLTIFMTLERWLPELVLLLSVIAVVVSLAGAPLASVIIYNTLALPLFVMNHSNMKYPAWYERWGSRLMVTPDWHRVHHSRRQPQTDSRYGCVFSVWDRLFGTSARASAGTIQFGLDRFRSALQSCGSIPE